MENIGEKLTSLEQAVQELESNFERRIKLFEEEAAQNRRRVDDIRKQVVHLKVSVNETLTSLIPKVDALLSETDGCTLDSNMDSATHFPSPTNLLSPQSFDDVPLRPQYQHLQLQLECNLTPQSKTQPSSLDFFSPSQNVDINFPPCTDITGSPIHSNSPFEDTNSDSENTFSNSTPPRHSETYESSDVNTEPQPSPLIPSQPNVPDPERPISYDVTNTDNPNAAQYPNLPQTIKYPTPSRRDPATDSHPKPAPRSINRPILFAAAAGDMDILRRLLESGVVLDVRNANEETALHLAASAGHERFVDVLLTEGAQVDATDRDSRTPLHKAAAGGYLKVARRLLLAGANREATDKDGRTPLLLAVGNGHDNMVSLLLNSGASTSVRDKNGDSLIMIAVRGRFWKVAELISIRHSVMDSATKDEQRDLAKLLDDK